MAEIIEAIVYPLGHANSVVMVDGQIIDSLNHPKRDFQFSQKTEFNAGLAKLSVEPLKSGNGIAIECIDEPSHNFLPADNSRIRLHGTKSAWNMSFGSDPNSGTTRYFGFSENLRLRYLGHPDREALSRLVTKQQEKYQPHVEHKMDDNGRLIFWTSPVIRSNRLVNLEGVEPDGGDGFSFQGSAMVYLELMPDEQSKNPNLSVAIATKADIDDLVRIRRIGYNPIRNPYKSAFPVALIREFGKSLDHLITDRFRGDFPLQVVDLLHLHLINGSVSPTLFEQLQYDPNITSLDCRYNLNLATTQLGGYPETQDLVNSAENRLKSLTASLN